MEEIIIQGETKKCNKCKKRKMKSDFCKNPLHYSDGLQTYCKKCCNQSVKKRVKKRIKGGLCIRCGFINNSEGRFCNTCKEKMNVWKKSYRKKENIKEKERKYNEKRKKNNKYLEWKRNYMRNYRKKRIATDINYKLSINLRTRLCNALKRNTKIGSAVKDLGISVSELKIYLEKQFLLGMSWENYGEGSGKWQIDHIIPLYTFDLTDREQFLKACHFTNLRPLWQIDNIKRYSLERDKWKDAPEELKE